MVWSLKFNQEKALRKKILQKLVPAFSLIEMSIVLVVIGIIAGAVFKGQELLESAKIRSIAQDFQHYSLSVGVYQETYQALPGDDSKASLHFSSAESGDGNGQITGREPDLFWQHLGKASIINTDTAPSSKLGGHYTVVFQPSTEMPGHWFMLSKEGGAGLLTPKQAQVLKNKIDQGNNATNPSQGQLIVKDASGAVGRCVRNGHLNLETTTAECVVYYRF
jgi:prepilin-type N-terminal cleavage/methylation domain-containing protein